MAIYYGDANGKAQEVIVVGKPGPQGPAGPQGAPGPQGPAGQGVPTGGTVGQVLTKKTASDYDAEWETVPSKRTCRFVVGTSTAGWTEADCDYLCDGTADDVEINAAIKALYAKRMSGEVVILSGIYKITKKIEMNVDNTTLRGNGLSTVLQRNFDAGDLWGSVIYSTAADFVIRDLAIDGNRNAYSNRLNTGLIISSVDNKHSGLVKNVCAFNNQDTGISVIGKNNIMLDSCVCHDNGAEGGDNYSGIYAFNCEYISITSCVCYNNFYAGIQVSGGTEIKSVIGNNTCYNNDVGIVLADDGAGSVTGNITLNNNIGIYLLVCKNNEISGNVCFRGTGLPSDYSSSQHTIKADGGSKNNLTIGNNIIGKNYVDSGINNTWANNKYQ